MGTRLNKGFSLVELMVAMSLLSLIIFVGSMSYSTFISSWSRINNKINSNINNARSLMLLRKSVNSTMAYVFRDEQQVPGLLFKGNSTELVSITSSPIFNNEYPSFFQLAFESNAQNSKVGQLVYREISSNRYFDIKSTLLFDNEMVLLREIHGFEIVYLGWQSYEDKLNLIDEEYKAKSWSNSYDSFQSLILPEAISIKFVDKNNENHVLFFNLLDGSEKLISRSMRGDDDA